MNRSSVTHNIISHAENVNSNHLTIGFKNRTILHRKKAVCTYSDESRPTAIHTNIDYNDALSVNHKLFRKNFGPCVGTYEAAHKYAVKNPFATGP